MREGTLQDMMKKMTEAGWRKAEVENVKEEDIRALFDLIDKDKSGSLSKRVKSKMRIQKEMRRLILILGSQESSQTD